MLNSLDRYDPIPNQLFINNRKKLFKKLLPNALVVIHSNDVMHTGTDIAVPFRQNTDLFYLTGINQPETILLLYPDAPSKEYRVILFIKKTTPEITIWEGPQYTKENARKCSGIEHINWLETFPTIFHTLMQQADYLYLYTDENRSVMNNLHTPNRRFVNWCKTHYPLHNYKRLAPIMQDLRIIKSQIEIDLIRKAYAITEKGLRNMFHLIKPGIKEYELEASLINTFTQEGASGFAYNPIIASGNNSCILHYVTNNKSCQAGELILLDVGAIYANYSSDVTRVVPVSGKFTPLQKKIYKKVLYIFEQAKQLLVSGTTLPIYEKKIGELMTQALVDLGLLSLQQVKEQHVLQPAYKKYFMHNTSHHLGLSTHDVADKDKPLSPGMVLTIEPGIYLPEQGFGVRLENAVVITNDGVEDLIPDLPLEPSSIEALINN